MNQTTVPSSPSSAAVLEQLQAIRVDLTPELEKLAVYLLEKPAEIAVTSIRQLAAKAEVKPNTLVRLSHALGMDSYETFREIFRNDVRAGRDTYPDRARWLQDLGSRGALGGLYAEMVGSALRNIEDTFDGIDLADLHAAAKMIWGARQVFTLGVGVNNANARNFTYLASTGMVQFHTVPKPGGSTGDDLAWADHRDVLIAITCKPYRTEVVQGVDIARDQGMRIIGISDSRASPILRDVDYGFLVACDTPQFFPSSVSTIALLETLLSLVIASASPEIVDRVAAFHRRRHDLGLYVEEAPSDDGP